MRTRDIGTPDDPISGYDDWASFQATVTSPPTGRFSIEYGGYHVDFAFRDAGSPTTVVCFHGAVQTSVTLPWHVGKSVVSAAGANWLSISDPSLLFGGGLTLAWYAGSAAQPALQDLITDVIAHVAAVSETKHLIFFGASGGGFASLEYSRRFPGSLSLPMNPQTSIHRHRKNTVQLYVDTAWGGDSPIVPKGDSRIQYDQTIEYVATFPNTVAYIQNSWDAYHIGMHLLPFFRAVGGHPSLRFLMGAWGDPSVDKHVPPEKSQITEILTAVTDSEGDWLPALASVGFTDDTDPATIRERSASCNDSATSDIA